MSLAERKARMDLIKGALKERILEHSDYLVSIPVTYPATSAMKYANRRGIGDQSPNGLISPDRRLSILYNAFVMDLIHWVDCIGLGDLIASWATPFYFRRKEGDQPNDLSKFQSEYKHLDSWAGEQPCGHRLSFVIDGDVEGNRVDLFNPPDDFDESWMNPIASYADGQHIADRYTPLPYTVGEFRAYIADMCLVHQTVRDPGCGWRISFDVSFLMKGAPLADVKPTSPSQRDHKMRISHEEMRRCGTDWIFLFNYDHSWKIHDLT